MTSVQWNRRPSQLIHETCVVCQGDGLCRPCRASGRSGFYLHSPPRSAPLCSWCKGSGRCYSCLGSGRRLVFTPAISVLTSRSTPTSITLAAWSGAGWRTIPIASTVFCRSLDSQRGWVAWRVQTHYRDEGGVCFLFGSITGYSWEPIKGVHFRFDRKGRLVDPGAFLQWVRSVAEVQL